MIDEPEINLHPKSQVLIARFLAKMVNRGIKIVVSTHSDYILRELSTLIIANNEFEGKEKLLNRYPEYQNQGLAAEKVGVYNFANHTIENIEITNKGIETASIDAVISRQNETSDAMYYTYLDSLPSEE
jgi:predicted ATPase